MSSSGFVSVVVFYFFFFNDTATTEIYTLSLHDALPICCCSRRWPRARRRPPKCSSRSEEHTSELQSRGLISYAVFCLKKKQKRNTTHTPARHKRARHTQRVHTLT